MEAKYSGGDGSRREEAIVIEAATHRVGVASEYAYIEKQLGPRGVAWDLDMQMSIKEEGRQYDFVTVTRKGADDEAYWFDITDFYPGS